MTNHIANEMTRTELCNILDTLRKANKVPGSGRASKLNSKALLAAVCAIDEQLVIETGASLGILCCFANSDPEPEYVAPQKSNASKAKASAVPTAKDKTKPGIIAAIIGFVTHKMETKTAFTRQEVHVSLVSQFPTRDPKSLMSTVRAQIPFHLRENKGFQFQKADDHKLFCISIGK